MRLSDFDYDLPEELIALRPARPRTAARLLVAEGARAQDRRVADLPMILRPGDLLVLNDTAVIPARLSGMRRRGDAEAGIEATLLERDAEGRWQALLRPLRKVRPGEVVRFSDALAATVAAVGDGRATLAFDCDGPAFDAALAEAGAMPLPPYIASRRAADARDREDYQSVWAARPGAVAAPTASLHFDAALLAALDARGVRRTHVTLHVGAGTFLPIKTDDVSRHRMHAERGEVPEPAARAVVETRAAGGRVIAVGTTALRVLETAALAGPGPWRGATDLFVRPGHRFRAVEGLMTNFHLPRSTLLMLVSALMGRERILALYAHAIAERYRFYSYGDATLLIP
jgi:S-adenosylmethionine:tRNA ribosyltransferase-isomerase